MKIDVEKMAGLANELKLDIATGCCRSSVPIGKISTVTFELVAYSRSEADDLGIGPIRDEHECITR